MRYVGWWWLHLITEDEEKEDNTRMYGYGHDALLTYGDSERELGSFKIKWDVFHLSLYRCKLSDYYYELVI